jgi:ABC-type glycerol-3-phosphate transport system substrate-binding protein
MRFAVSALVVMAIVCAPCLAGAKTLDCAIQANRDSQGWIGKRTIVEWDEAAGTAEVMDDIIYAFNEKKPMQATVRVVSPAQTVFSWSLMTTDSTGQNARQIYRATFFPANQKMVVSSKPGGYIQDYVARGTCVVK